MWASHMARDTRDPCLFLMVNSARLLPYVFLDPVIDAELGSGQEVTSHDAIPHLLSAPFGQHGQRLQGTQYAVASSGRVARTEE